MAEQRIVIYQSTFEREFNNEDCYMTDEELGRFIRQLGDKVFYDKDPEFESSGDRRYFSRMYEESMRLNQRATNGSKGGTASGATRRSKSKKATPKPESESETKNDTETVQGKPKKSSAPTPYTKLPKGA